VGCGSGSGSLLSVEKKGGKEEGPLFGSSPVGVSSPVVKKDRKEILGLKVSSPSSGGASPIVGGALPSFAEVVRSEGPVKFRFPLVERSADFLPTVRPTTLEEVRRISLDYSVLEKEPLGKDLPLNLQGQGAFNTSPLCPRQTKCSEEDCASFELAVPKAVVVNNEAPSLLLAFGKKGVILILANGAVYRGLYLDLEPSA